VVGLFGKRLYFGKHWYSVYYVGYIGPTTQCFHMYKTIHINYVVAMVASTELFNNRFLEIILVKLGVPHILMEQ